MLLSWMYFSINAILVFYFLGFGPVKWSDLSQNSSTTAMIESHSWAVPNLNSSFLIVCSPISTNIILLADIESAFCKCWVVANPALCRLHENSRFHLLSYNVQRKEEIIERFDRTRLLLKWEWSKPLRLLELKFLRNRHIKSIAYELWR